MNLRELQASPEAFRQALLIDTDGEARRLGDCLDPWQRQDFEALDPGWRRVVGQRVSECLQRAWLERPRGHSKTADIATMLAWALFAARKKISGVCAAGDEDQAALLREAVSKLVSLNPWLGEFLEVQRTRIVNKHTGSELVILSSDAPTSYGLTPDFIICDELTHWKGRALWDSLFSSAAKRMNCLLLVIANAGFQDSWQWELRERVRVDPDWYFNRLDGPQASWISEKHLAEQRRLLPQIAYDRLWLNRWSSGSGDALREADINAATTLDGPLFEQENGWVYIGGLDLGLKRDASAFAVVGVHVGWTERKPLPQRIPPGRVLESLVELGMLQAPRACRKYETIYHRGSGRIKLVRLSVWRPGKTRTVDLEEIEREILSINQSLPLAAVGFDPWQAAYLGQRLAKAGLRVEQTDFSGNNLKAMCQSTLEAFTERQIDLFADEHLLADLRGLRVEERAYGVRLTSPRGPNGHGDSATALAIALLIAGRVGRWNVPQERFQQRKLVWSA